MKKRQPDATEVAVAQKVIELMRGGCIYLNLENRELQYGDTAISEIMKVIFSHDPELVVGNWITDLLSAVLDKDALLALHPDYASQNEELERQWREQSEQQDIDDYLNDPRRQEK